MSDFLKALDDKEYFGACMGRKRRRNPNVIEVTCSEISECKKMCQMVYNLIRRVGVEEVVCVNPKYQETLIPIVKRASKMALLEDSKNVVEESSKAPSKVQETLEAYVS